MSFRVLGGPVSQVARFPFVSKADILRAYRPGAEPSERTFRTLRGHGLVSGGVVVRRRQLGRVTGQLRCYAALNVDAAVLARHDRRQDAEHLAAEAGRFEVEWEPLVGQLVTRFAIDDFEAFRTARDLIAADLAPATAALDLLRRRAGHAVDGLVSERFVRLGRVTAEWATLELVGVKPETSPRPAPLDEAMAAVTRAVPRLDPLVSSALADALAPLAHAASGLAVDPSLLQAAGLGPGELAVLRIERSAGISLLSLLAATGDDDFVLDPEVAPYFSDEPLPASVVAQVEARAARGGAIRVPGLETIPLAS